MDLRSSNEQVSDLTVHPSKWSVARVLEFVGGLGLDHLKPAFSKNVVDGEQLLDLSYTDLEEDLEIESQEEIHRILGAINYLRSSYKKRRPKEARYGSNVDEENEDEEEETEEEESIHRNLHSHLHSQSQQQQPQQQQQAHQQHHQHPHPHYNQYVIHPQVGPGYAGMNPYQVHIPRVPLLPMAALHEHLPCPWTIKARVISKTEMLQWNETTHFFTVDLADPHPQQDFSIRAMLVNEVADKFHPVVEIGKTYIIYSGGSKVQRAPQRFPHLTSDHEINLAVDAEITFLPDEEEDHSHLPVQQHVHPQEVNWNQPSELTEENSVSVPHAHGQEVHYDSNNNVVSNTNQPSASLTHSHSHPPHNNSLSLSSDSSSSSAPPSMHSHSSRGGGSGSSNNLNNNNHHNHHDASSSLSLSSSSSSSSPASSSPSLRLPVDSNGDVSSSSSSLPLDPSQHALHHSHSNSLASSSSMLSPSLDSLSQSAGLDEASPSVTKRRKLDNSSAMPGSLQEDALV